MLQLKIMRAAFFGNKISPHKKGVCCRYNQNHKPMTVQTAKATYAQLQRYLEGWRLQDECRILRRTFYLENYLLAIQFINDAARIDALEFENTPGFKLSKGEILEVELYSVPLNGLSQIDFRMALRINEMNLKKYQLQGLSHAGASAEIKGYKSKRALERAREMIESRGQKLD